MMKKLVLNIIIFLTVISTKNVYAANYQIKELIPINKTATIKGENFLYKNISYNNNSIIIEKILNNSYEEKPISIQIGLFDEKKLNIGIIILCEEDNILESKKDILNYKIDIEEKYLGENKSTNDIKYISVINENETCRKSGYKDFLGKKVEDIGKINTLEKDEKALLFINILKVVAIVLIVIFIYNFIYTNKYRNIDNDDIRKSYNKKKVEKREEPTSPQEQKTPPNEVKKEESQISIKDIYK